MNQDTKNKFAQLMNAANKKENSHEIKANDTVKYKGAVITAKVDNVLNDPMPAANLTFEDGKKEIAYIEDLQKVEPSKMVSFTIIWHEGTGSQDGKVFNTWNEANKAMKIIYSDFTGEGYYKTKVCVKWENGKEIIGRIDVGNCGSDFCPSNNTIGEYLKKLNSVMYSSNIEKGERYLLSFEDKEEINTQLPEMSEMTITDLLPNLRPSPEVIENKLKVVDYSEKAIAIIGDTYSVKEILKRLGGRFNYNLTCGAGWIFSKSKADLLRKELKLTF